MKKWIIIFLMSLIGFSGCQTTIGNEAQKPADLNPEDLPDVRAFQDEFTREFLQSTEVTKDGYYPFLSGTGRYEMDFPGGGVIGEKSYALKEVYYEGLSIGVEHMNGTESFIKINYDATDERGNEENVLRVMQDQFEEELQFDQHTSNNQNAYLAYFEDDYGYYGYAAFLQNTQERGRDKDDLRNGMFR